MSTLFTLKLQNSFDLGLEELEVEYKDGETTRLEVWIRSGEGDFWRSYSGLPQLKTFGHRERSKKRPMEWIYSKRDGL